MEVDHRNRNCYNCGRFKHLARNCKNRKTGDRIGKGRRLEYEGDNGPYNNNLNKDRDLIVSN